MKVPQDVMDHKTLMVALMAYARDVARELEVDIDMPVARLAAALGANRTAVYQQKDRVAAALSGLVAVGPGRPAARRNERCRPVLESLELTIRVLEFRVRNLDAAVEHERRTSYSPAFRRFILKELDGWSGTHADFAAASKVPPDTLKDWGRDDAAGLESAKTERPEAQIPVDASETTRSILEAFEKWQGSTRAFLRVTGKRLGHSPTAVARVLRICGAIKPRRRRAFQYRGSTQLLSPGMLLVTDGKTLDIELTHSGQRLQRNWQGIVDQATGCDTAVVVTQEENGRAAKDAFRRSVEFLGNMSPAGLLHDGHKTYRSGALRRAAREEGTLLVQATARRPENKGILENAFSLFEARVGTIRLDDRTLTTLIDSAVSEVLRAYTAVTNSVPRKELGGKSRMAALREACPSAEEQEADRAFIRQLKEDHDRVKGATWRDKARPATRRLLDWVFAILGLEDRDPKGKLRLYLSIYDPAAIRRAAAIVAARLERGLLDPAFAHRYLVKVIQAQQESLDLEREELLLLRLARQSAQDWVSAETEEYQQLKRELQSQPLDLACALAERAAESGIPVAAAFWTERLLEHVDASRHLLGAVRRFLVRLYEAPTDRRLSLIDRLVALEWGVS